MANMKSNKKPLKTTEERNAARRARVLRIIFIVFSIMLILSMILQLTSY
jgi:hypothetical protein